VRNEEAGNMKTEDYLNPIIEAIVKEEEEVVRKWVSEGLAAGIDPMAIINQGLTIGLRKVGDLFAEEEIFLPGLVMSAQIVTRVLEELKPRLKSDRDLMGFTTLGKISSPFFSLPRVTRLWTSARACRLRRLLPKPRS
jgi:methanogenic corrinoid protein MtbC1